jgi:uncharacterized membrane protein YdbT with pleckstrin-like domain
MADAYLQKLLGNGEEVILVDRQHWFVLLRNIFVEGAMIVGISVLTIVLMSTLANQSWSGYLALLFLLVIPPLISGFMDFFQWYNRKFIVTTWRVIQLSGVINKDVIDSSLEKVNDIELSQSFFGRIFGFGTVEILTASEIGVNKFKMIGNPVRFKTAIVNAKERLGHDDDRRVSSKEAPGVQAAPTAAADIPAMIDRLDGLRQRGVLSEDEFQRSKQQLLQKLSESQKQ